MHGLLCWSVVVGWSIRSVGVAVAQIEVNIVIILLVLVVGAVHVRVVARVLLLWSRIRGVMVIIVVVVVAVVAGRLSHGGGNGLWGRGSGSPRGRIIVVAVFRVSQVCQVSSKACLGGNAYRSSKRSSSKFSGSVILDRKQARHR
jgi:hypothetical protein